MPGRTPGSMRPDVRLRNVTTADPPILFEQQLDPEANAMAAFPPRKRDALMEHWTRIISAGGVAARVILLGDAVAGYVVTWEQDGRQLVGYWIGRGYWGRGIATRALFEFLDLIGTRPLYAYVAQHNAASIRVLTKCDFSPSSAAAPAADLHLDELVFVLYAER